MRTIKALPLVLGGVAILGVVWLLYGVAQQIQPTGARLGSPSTAGNPVDVFRMDGMSYTAHDGEKIRFRLKADRVEVAKRKYGMLYVNPLKEATFSNLALDVYEGADAKDSGGHSYFVRVQDLAGNTTWGGGTLAVPPPPEQ